MCVCTRENLVKNGNNNKSTFLSQISPPWLKRVTALMCGACGVENAMKVAFMRYMVSTLPGSEYLTRIGDLKGS